MSALLIGLTGSIASGKSTVSGQLTKRGAYVIDADIFARKAVEKGTKGLRQLRAVFGSGIIAPDGNLDRFALGAIVFRDDTARNLLNAILHPIIIERMQEATKEYLSQHPEGIVVWDAALLIECGAQRFVDEVWLVTAPNEARLERIVARDGLSLEEASLRMAAQIPDDEKRRYATRIIENDGDLPALIEKVNALFDMVIG